MPASRKAHARNGRRLALKNRGRSMLPRHIPPIKDISSTASETAVEPITSCSIWNQMISYINAAQPLAPNNRLNWNHSAGEWPSPALDTDSSCTPCTGLGPPGSLLFDMATVYGVHRY